MTALDGNSTPQLLKIPQVCEICQFGRATFHRRAHEFDVVKIGRATRVTRQSVNDWLEKLPRLKKFDDDAESDDEN